MKILIVSDAWHPQVNGVVRTLDNLILHLRARDHEVEVISPDQFYNFPLPTYREIRIAVTFPSTVKARIEASAPDHVHIATEGPLGFAAAKSCDALGYRFTTSYHTRFPEYLNARLPVPVDWTYSWLRNFHNRGSACLVATRSIAGDLRNRGFENLAIWTRGVDRELFRPEHRNVERFLSDLPRPFFLNVGRLAVEKNIDDFLSLKLPGTRIVVGDGPDRERLQTAFPDAVFLGERHGTELAEIYASCDVFVFPSLTDTFGNVILESLACGTPVAAFPVRGPKDILVGTRAGIIDHDLQRACMSALKLNCIDALRHSANYTWETCADQFLMAIKHPEDRRKSAENFYFAD